VTAAITAARSGALPRAAQHRARTVSSFLASNEEDNVGPTVGSVRKAMGSGRYEIVLAAKPASDID
jgi:hypothetical protein